MTGWQVLPDRLDVRCDEVHIVLASARQRDHPGEGLPDDRCRSPRQSVSDWHDRVLARVLSRTTEDGGRPARGERPLAPGRRGSGRATWRHGIAVAGNGDQIAVALSTRAAVGISMQDIPWLVDEFMCQILSPPENRLLDQVPVGARGEVAARMWTRKDAALRLTGDRVWGAMRGVMTVPSGSSWNVTVPDADGHSCRTVGVYDLPRCDRSVSALASDSPPGHIYTWLFPE